MKPSFENYSWSTEESQAATVPPPFLSVFFDVATAEFSKFVGILSAAFSQHHLLGLEIAQLEFYHLKTESSLQTPQEA